MSQEQQTQPPIRFSPKLAKRLMDETGVNVMECYQCGKCSSGCTMAADTDLLPHDIVRLIQFDELATLLNSKGLWLCVGCEACSTRCPNQIQIPELVDHLRKMAIESGQNSPEPELQKFHEAFLLSIKKNGRVHEVGMIGDYKMATGDYFKDFKKGMAMFFRGKLKILPTKIKGRNEVKEIFETVSNEKSK